VQKEEKEEGTGGATPIQKGAPTAS